MGGRGATSATGRGGSTGGGSVIGPDGMISLDPQDYQGMSKDEVYQTMQQLPYEALVFFDDNGNVAKVVSQGNEGEVSWTMRDASGAKEHYHNHPTPVWADEMSAWSPIFSPEDIGTYATMADFSETWGGYPSSYTVKSQWGQTFTLDYVGGGKRDKFNFETAFRKKLNAAFNKYNTAENVFGKGVEWVNEQVTIELDNYLTRNAKNYGFRYTSSGVKGGYYGNFTRS